jgi:hypothetical protein
MGSVLRTTKRTWVPSWTRIRSGVKRLSSMVMVTVSVPGPSTGPAAPSSAATTA